MKMSRLPAIPKKDSDWLKNKIKKHRGTIYGNMSYEIVKMLRYSEKHGYFEDKEKNVDEHLLENNRKNTDPYTQLQGNSSDHQKCHFDNLLLTYFDNSYIYEKTKTTKNEIIKLIESATCSKVSTRKWTKYSKLLRDSGRIIWIRGTKDYRVDRSKFAYASSETITKFNRINEIAKLRFSSIAIENYAMNIYENYEIGDVIDVREIELKYKIYHRTLDLTIEGMKNNNMIEVIDREYIKILDYREEARKIVEKEFGKNSIKSKELEAFKILNAKVVE